jgi:hypothetical protein
VTALPRSTADRLTALVLGQDLTVAAAIRELAAGTDGGAPVTVSRNGADRVVRDARAAVSSGADIPTAAARVLKLASRELAALEAEPGPKDLDRLHKIAQILGTIERLRPKRDETQEAGLLSLQEQADPAQNGTG